MAFHQPAPAPRQLYISQPDREESIFTSPLHDSKEAEESQEWVLFSPSQAVSTSTGTRTDGTPQTAALSRISDFGSLVTRSGQPTRTNADDLLTEDGELDSLDEGLHAFREPSVYRTSSNQGQGALLPTHDGLGMFPASSTPVQDQLWQHEQYNPKRKYEGGHVRRSSLQRRLDSIEVLDLQINEEKRMRIEQWRFEQSQVLLDEIQRETRRRERDRSIGTRSSPTNLEADIDLLGTTPKQKDIASLSPQETEEVEPFWRRVTRKFIRDVIGIDEPLLSIIVGETLPEDMHSITNLVGASEAGPHQASFLDETWPDRLLHRIARELGLLVNKLSPHPGAFAAASSFLPPDYAGIPISERPSGKADESRDHDPESASRIAPLFSPTMHDPIHNASWGLEDGPIEESNDATRLRLEREYWERELDIKMVFRFLNSRFSSSSSPSTPAPGTQDATSYQQPPTTTHRQTSPSTLRVDLIRQHHPLVAARARQHQHQHQPSISRLRHDSSLRSLKRSVTVSSCANESARSGRRASLVRSGSSSRHYWDLGGSAGSGSATASGGLMGAWGEV